MTTAVRQKLDVTWRAGNLVAVFWLCLSWTGVLAVDAARSRLWFDSEPGLIVERVASASERIDPNIACAASLQRLHGIGPVLAAAIVSQRRERNLQFRYVEDLADVKGIGPGTIRAIRPYLDLPSRTDKPPSTPARQDGPAER